ncbi:hypothetical protein Vqi01_58600 [Micromonospora qiuiae]|uniref:Mrr-like domain-containing protein n=1 Tax=Micromonospora qiuiae TaxID=502268 RepID=A0ABQ4JJB9_9ACTN|nr:hypothetical protein [Micromonospora qiuiae]GIJ30698.1 hypothetical protein Vqi01_58600 [Micromonospora qiuiae]
MDDGDRALPRWLSDHDAFTAHLNEQLADENPHGKGLRFVNFVLAVLPRVPQVSEFTDFERNKRLSHDKGVDILTAATDGGRQLFVQSKFKIRRTDEIDTILSLFEALSTSTGSGKSPFKERCLIRRKPSRQASRSM